MSGESERVEEPMNGAGSDHQTGINRAANDPSKRIPCPIIEPIMKLVKSFFSQKLGGAIIEIGIELMDHYFITQNRKEAYGKS